MIYVSARYLTPPPYTETSMVEGTDADGNKETVPANHTLFRQPDDGPIGYINNGGVIAEYVAPVPTDQTCPQCHGSGRIPL